MSAMGIVIGMAVILGIITIILSKRERSQKMYRKIVYEFGTRPKEREDSIYRICNYHKEIKERYVDFVIDEVTWNDLDMDAIFWRINHTQSYVGEQVLYHHLHLMDENDDVKSNRKRRIDYFMKEEKSRIKLEFELAKIGKQKDDYFLPSFLLHAIDMIPDGMQIFYILQAVFFISLLSAIGGVIFLGTTKYFSGFIMIAAVNIAVYSFNKLKFETYLSALGSISSLLNFSISLQKKKGLKEFLEEEESEDTKAALKRLSKLGRQLNALMIKKKSAFSGDVFDSIRDYIIGMTMWDFTIYTWIIKRIKEYQNDLITIYEYIGMLDMDIAIASYKKEMNAYCEPEIWDEEKIVVEELVHPLLDEAVANDFSLTKKCVITGSNASGKSTFLKALAINVILAQNIGVCTAAKLKIPKMHVMTSMTVRDDILSGESYYMKEIHYLKRMIDESHKNVLTLYIIDEILRGTNAKERLAASLSVLNYLEQKQAFLIVATHDMPMAHMLEKDYLCCSFGNYIEEEQIVFDYKIHEGFLETKNAIVLLKSAGFPEEIVKNAISYDEALA